MALIYIATMACLGDFALKMYRSSSDGVSEVQWPVFGLPYALLCHGVPWREENVLKAWLSACASVCVPIFLTALYVKSSAQRMMWVALVAFSGGMAFYSLWNRAMNHEDPLATQLSIVAVPVIAVIVLIAASVTVSLLCNRRLIHTAEEEPVAPTISVPLTMHQPEPMAPPGTSGSLYDPFGDMVKAGAEAKPAEKPKVAQVPAAPPGVFDPFGDTAKLGEIAKLAQAPAAPPPLFDPFADFPKPGEEPSKPQQTKAPAEPAEPAVPIDPFTNLPKIEPKQTKAPVPEWDPFGSPST